MSTEKKWYESTNFTIAAIMTFLGVSYGVSEQDAHTTASGLFGLIAGIGIIRERIKSNTPDWKAWALSKNTWNYAFAALAQVVVSLPAGLGDEVYKAVQAIAGKNWSALLPAVMSIGTIIYFWLFAPKRPQATKAQAIDN